MPTITASTNGGYVLANNQSSHANARNAASGNVIVTQASRVSTSLSYVRAAGRGGSTVYAIYRSFLQFDTSGITGTVSSATLKIYGYINGTADLKIVKSGGKATWWNMNSNESNFFNISNVTYTAININPPTNSYFNSSTYYLPKKEF